MSSDIEIIEEQRAVLGSVPVKPYSLIVILLLINTFCPCQTLQRYKILYNLPGTSRLYRILYLACHLACHRGTGRRKAVPGEGLGLQPKCDDWPNNTGIVLDAVVGAVDLPRLRIDTPSISRRILRSRPIPIIIKN